MTHWGWLLGGVGNHRRRVARWQPSSGAVAIGAVIALGSVLGPLATAAPAQSAQSALNVYVGYADSTRANAANFPTPWGDGSNSQVIFEGCQPTKNCVFDGGAVRLVNNSASAVTVNSVKVEYSPSCIYDIWPHDVTLPSGKALIVAQLSTTTPKDPAGCTNTTNTSALGYGQIDGSDIGPGGTSWDRGCKQSGIIPQVDLTVNGSPTTFSDSGQVLNTGGVDSAFCPIGARNESVQWTPIGSVACLGASLMLTPSSQNATSGGTATVVATLLDGCGKPLQGASANFHVSGASAPNAGAGGSSATNSQGQASFTYPDVNSGLGTDQVQAMVSNPAGTLSSNIVHVTWVAPSSAGGSPGSGGSKVPLSVITGLSIHPASFVAAHTGPTVMVAATKRKAGALVSYKDSHPAITSFHVYKVLPGRGHRLVLIGYFTRNDVAGTNHFWFTGRLHGRKLAPGSYLLKVVAHNSGGAGPTRTHSFRITRG
jgi:hypothetical protein